MNKNNLTQTSKAVLLTVIAVILGISAGSVLHNYTGQFWLSVVVALCVSTLTAALFFDLKEVVMAKGGVREHQRLHRRGVFLHDIADARI